MKTYVVTTAAASILFGLCLFISGCGKTSMSNPKAEMQGGMTSSEMTMSGNMMSDNKMSSMGKMNDPKMDGMADGKMETN
jgi:hypothetical protein